MRAFLDLIKQTVSDWSEHNVSRLAAALSYYTVFSLPPLLVISLAIAGRFYDRQRAQDQIVAQANELLGVVGGDAIRQILENASDPELGSLAAIISVVVLIFGASGVFAQLQETMNTIWGVRPKEGGGLIATIKDRFVSFTMVLGVGFLLLVSLIFSAILAAMGEWFLELAPEAEAILRVSNFVVAYGVTAILFALIFKVIPDVQIRWGDVWLGALVTAFLFSIGRWAIGLYLGRSAPATAYGAAGSLIVVMLWVYYSAQILFMGAEFTKVYANKYGGRIRPDEGAELDSDHHHQTEVTA